MNKEAGTTQLLNDLFRNIQNSPVATAIITQSNQHINYVNEAYLKLFNRKRNLPDVPNQEELFPELLHPLVRQVIGNAVQLGIAVKEAGIRINLKNSSGVEQLFIDCYAAPIIDEENRVTADVILTILDMSHITPGQKQSQEKDRSYRNLMESMAIAVYTCDTEGRVNFYNHAAITLWGRKPELGVELWCGSHKMYTLDGNWMPHDKCPAAVSLKENRAVKAEALVQRPDGKMRHVLVFPRPEYDDKGQVTGLINAVVDITDRKALERQKDDFMGIVAHELKTPVTSLLGYTQLLKRKFTGMGDEKSNQMQARIDLQLNNITSLINRMLNAAKIESGEFEFKKEQFNLPELVSEVLENTQLTTTTHRLLLVPGENIEVIADRSHVAQVVINLLSNAIKYSPKADRVIVNVSELNNKVICSVQDFGFGIPADQVNGIFEKFYRVKAENVTRLPGIGLGLYLSAAIIRQQGGEIWVDSKVNEGSNFSFSLEAVK